MLSHRHSERPHKRGRFCGVAWSIRRGKLRRFPIYRKHTVALKSLAYPRWCWLALALFVTALVYWPGLYGGWLFDDYPNIVDNHGVQPTSGSLPSLINAALSSPASDFKRPLASLSFAANYLTSGLDPFWMKLTNLCIHLLNGVLVFVLARGLLHLDERTEPENNRDLLATLIAAGWLLLPINLTAVLYVVQRMESLANLFVLLGLIGYISGRRAMRLRRNTWPGFLLCLFSISIPTAVGLLAKETAVMLPLYAFCIEWVLLGFRCKADEARDWRLITLFVVTLALPMIVGSTWVLPGLLRPEAWAARDFSLGTRLLTETRVVIDYIGWTVLPLSSWLSFYHDDYAISASLYAPWTTLASTVALAALLALALLLRRRRPLITLGLLLFLSCHVLTATVLPLELVYEHRNYFASFGLILALMCALLPSGIRRARNGDDRSPTKLSALFAMPNMSMQNARWLLVAVMMLWWTGLTTMTSYEWGDPLRLAQALAERGPSSPRAQYELGRTYIIFSQYDPNSPFTQAAYAPLERAAALPKSSILPQQALIFMNSRIGRPIKEEWWDSMIAKLAARKPGVQDESSLAALTQCAKDGACALPTQRMVQAFRAAASHSNPSPRLLATYGDYAWNILNNHDLGESLVAQAVEVDPAEPAYQITLVRMLAAEGRKSDANEALIRLEALNTGGRLNHQLGELRRLPGLQ